jgi:enamine deaminase RidA (YjgF/YER057c/UK114 family)
MHKDIEEAARMLYQNIKADIENAGTRIEHIRLTSLAQEASNLLTDIENYNGSSEAVVDSPSEEI